MVQSQFRLIAKRSLAAAADAPMMPGMNDLPDLHAQLGTMKQAASKAAGILREKFADLGGLTVERKKPADFVSEADLLAEKAIFDTLKGDWPGYGFHLEEGGIVEGTDADFQWVVDPLDGTTNFLHGLPHFSISIALVAGARPVAGVVCNPAANETFVAAQGMGATLNDKPIRVSAREELSSLLLGTGMPFRDKQGHEAFAQELVGPMKATAGVRRFGSAALDLSYVACGRFDAFWEHDLSRWDVAAGIIIVREAGGLVTALDGSASDLPHRSILASNGKVHDSVRALCG